MSSVRLQGLLLAVALFAIGLGSMAYQVFEQKVPLRQDQHSQIWTIDTEITIEGADRPIKASLYIPPFRTGPFTPVDENFISGDYGVKVNQLDENRRVTWSSRRGRGKKSLYYRLVTTGDSSLSTQPAEPGPQFREAPEFEGKTKVAVEALVGAVRARSSDTETFISEAIELVRTGNSDEVVLLVGKEGTPAQQAHAVNQILSAAHIPTQKVHTLRLSSGLNAEEGGSQKPELWLRSFNGKEWLYFNVATGQQGLPSDRLVWWVGDDPVLQVEGASNVSVAFQVHTAEMGVLELAKSMYGQDRSSFIDFSLYELPISSQLLLGIILMIPIGVLLVVFVRSMVGIETLGTFTPVLIALAFRETRVVTGVLLFTGITAAGLVVRSYLEYLKLKRIERLAVLLIFVILMMIVVSIASFRMGLSFGLSVGLFPMVILTMVIERVSISWEERGAAESMRLAVATLIVAVFCHLLMSWQPLRYILFTFPGALFVVAGFIVLSGHYRGYRLSELVRFKALAEDDR